MGLMALATLVALTFLTSATASNSTATSLTQLAEKLLAKVNSHLGSTKRSRNYDGGWNYLEGYSNELYGKSDYSWIVPLVIVVGFGTLLIPLMGTLMTTMVTQGTINLTAGRRRKRSTVLDDLLSHANDFKPWIKTVEEALTNFSKHLE